MGRHELFVLLIAGAVVVVRTTGMQFWLFTGGRISLSRHGLGLDFFALFAWCAVYWSGPRVRSIGDPHPFRIVAIVTGVLGMLAWLTIKAAVEL